MNRCAMIVNMALTDVPTLLNELIILLENVNTRTPGEYSLGSRVRIKRDFLINSILNESLNSATKTQVYSRCCTKIRIAQQKLEYCAITSMCKLKAIPKRLDLTRKSGVRPPLERPKKTPLSFRRGALMNMQKVAF